jgi:hypothetical protein
MPRRRFRLQGDYSMKPGETVRVECGECQIAFDITVAPRDQWPELPEEEGEDDTECDLMPRAECPFCGKRELKVQSDQPTYFAAAHLHY